MNLNNNENEDFFLSGSGQGFDVFGIGEDEAKAAESGLEESQVVEAIQIVRVVKSTVGKRSRAVLDTIVVNYPSMTYERALKIARHKAKMLGNCMVVEKLERLVCSF